MWKYLYDKKFTITLKLDQSMIFVQQYAFIAKTSGLKEDEVIWY